MKRTAILAAVMISIFLVSASAPSDASTFSASVQSGGNDAVTRILTGQISLSGTSMYIGRGYINGWRFENVQIPKGATISSARLQVYCTNYQGNAIRIEYSGENSDNAAPLAAQTSELINRAKTAAKVSDAPGSWTVNGWNESPDIASIVQEIVNRSGWTAGNALLLFARDSGSSSVRIINTADRNTSFGAKLTVTYADSEAPTVPTAAKCEFDTNRDGVPDIVLYDTDGDGFYEVPPGKIEYNGILVIDKPLELLGADISGRTGALLKGDGLIITEGGIVISELVLHPERANDYPGLKGIDFQAVTRNSIQIEYGGEVLLGGIGSGTFAGDILFQTTRPGANIFLQGDFEQQGTWVYGRAISLDSGGSIYVTGKLFMEANYGIVLNSRQGDINLNRDSILWAGNGYTINMLTTDGDVNLARGVEMAADTVDMCRVTGAKNDDGTTHLIGTKQCW